MISFKQKGDFSKLNKYFKKVKGAIDPSDFEKFGEAGVAALAAATPMDSGLTAKSWYYEITQKDHVITISFRNSNIQKGVPIAIILQYGHATSTGGWVQGRDYINPAIRPVFDEIAEAGWKEVTKL